MQKTKQFFFEFSIFTILQQNNMNGSNALWLSNICARIILNI
jgi:hypothetical protein